MGKPNRSKDSASLLTLLPVAEALSLAFAMVDVSTGRGRLCVIVCSVMTPGAPHRKAVMAAVAQALATALLCSLIPAFNCVEDVLCASC